MTSPLRNWIIAIALLFPAAVATSFQLLSESPPRVLAERFAKTLQGGTDARADEYLAPDAQVFLQGSTTSMSRLEFRAYLDILKRNRQAFQAASPVYTTDTGAGWLLKIERLTDAGANPSTTDLPPQLWMQVRIDGNQITRVWIHFTVEGLRPLHMAPDAYRAAAEVHGFPVPEAWSDGTPAMVVAAQRATDQADGGWNVSRKQTLMLAACLPAALILLVALWRNRSRRREPKRVPNGRLMACLREVRRPDSSGCGRSQHVAIGHDPG